MSDPVRTVASEVREASSAGTPKTPHRWSGWPGAWCLDCGCEDPVEIAVADGRFDVDDETCVLVLESDVQVSSCPEPGSNRCNPYAGGS